MIRHGHLVLVLPVFMSVGSCGGERNLDPPVPASSPWLLTYEYNDGYFTGTRRAHRVHEGKVEHVILESSALNSVLWSPTGRWVAFTIRLPNGAMGVSLRRFDGERWYDPQLVTPLNEGEHVSVIGWSPAHDQLLYTSRTLDSGYVTVAVATPRDDGSIATNVIGSRDSIRANWASKGDRIWLLRGHETNARIVMVDVRTDDLDSAWSSREISPPEGASFGDSPYSHGGPGWTLSSDGRWIVVPVTTEDGAPTVLRAVSTMGEDAPAALDACPVGRRAAATGDRCSPSGWLPQGATLLIDRWKVDGSASIDAWSPATGAVVSLGNVKYEGWVGQSGMRILLRDLVSNRLSIVDMGDGSKIEVPTTDQPTFTAATRSYDGRWLVLDHRDDRAGWFGVLDLWSAPPWQPREVHADGLGLTLMPYWSPGGRFLFLVREFSPKLQKGVRIDLEAAAARTIDVSVPPDPTVWRWDAKVADDDRSVAIDRDGMLAVWQMDAPVESAIVIDGVTSSMEVTWAPTK
ncbi:MAG: hypothetical protein J0I07_43910 [Myxococcales bacterium]|nr:hypothetical protein [Myxococcales bacterium]